MSDVVFIVLILRWRHFLVFLNHLIILAEELFLSKRDWAVCFSDASSDNLCMASCHWTLDLIIFLGINRAVTQVVLSLLQIYISALYFFLVRLFLGCEEIYGWKLQQRISWIGRLRSRPNYPKTFP